MACEQDLVLDSVADASTADSDYAFTNAHVTLELMTGEPGAFNDGTDPLFAKLFEIYGTINGYTVSEPLLVVVTGSYILSQEGSFEFPQYMPLAVLYDPPGGLSFAEYNNAEVEMTIEHKGEKFLTGDYSTFFIGAAAEGETFPCGGIGVQICNRLPGLLYSAEGLAGVDVNSERGTGDADDNYGTTASFTIQFSLATSQEAVTAGEDLYVTPALSIVYATVYDIEYDYATCTSSRITNTRWFLTGDTTKVYSLKTQSDIEDVTIPELQAEYARLTDELEELQATGGTNTVAYEVADAKRLAVLNATDGWNSILAYTTDIKAQAANDSLTGLTRAEHLLPSSMLEGAETLDGSDAAADDLDATYAIGFTGGGQLYKYTETSLTSATSTESSYRTFHINSGLEFEVQLGYVKSKGSRGSGFGIQHESETTQVVESSVEYAFTLGDADEGDEFNVRVYRDPTYGTFVFHTVSGSSSCVAEKNTFSRFNPTLALAVTPAAAFPDDEVVFDILIKNEGTENINAFLYFEGSSGAAIQLPGSENENYIYELPPGMCASGSRKPQPPLPLSVMSDHSFLHPLAYLSSSSITLGSTETAVRVSRVDSQYSYNIRVSILPSCEVDLLVGQATASRLAIESLDLTANFLQDCSRVHWADYLARELTFIVNEETRDVGDANGQHKNEVRLELFNPEYKTRPWANNTRLLSVKLEYRRVGDLDYSTGVNPDGNFLDASVAGLESDYGTTRN